MPAFTVILFTAAAAAAGPNAAFEISANGRRMQPLASALPSPTSTNSPSYGPTVSYAVSYATTIASKYASVSPSVSVSNHVIASPSASFVIDYVGGVSRSLVLGAFGNGIFILSSVLPALNNSNKDGQPLLPNWLIYLVMIIAAFICGVGQALLWTGQGYYIS